MSRPNILTPEQMPILRPLPMADDAPHRSWEVMEDWYLNCIPLGITFFIPKGFIFNGASVPRFFSNIFPATGYLFIAALIHDYLYKYGYYLKIDIPRAYSFTILVTKSTSDDIFESIADWLYKDHWFKTNIAKAALVVGGRKTWNNYRKADGTYIKSPEYVYWGDDEYLS